MFKSYEAQYKALDGEKGTFEAIVAVFGNVDLMGDKIMPGAFTNSLAAWAAKGRPIPVVFSHQWGNLDAHIGYVLEAKEVEQGLYVKAQLELDEPFAARVWKKMQKGTLAEFSFAYDVPPGGAAWVEGKNGDGYHELRTLDIIEVGPCLKGVNPETELLGVKGARGIQAAHDLLHALGAKCPAEGGGEGESEDEAGGDAGKSSGTPSALAERLRIEALMCE